MRLVASTITSLIFLIIHQYGNTQTEFNQVLLSETWTGQGGGSALFYQNVTKTDGGNNVYVAGTTISANNDYDISLIKYDRRGNLLWQTSFNGADSLNDHATDIFIDTQGNVYLTGTVVQSAQNQNDLIVLKYNSSGTQQWSYIYDSSDSSSVPMDFGTAITGDNSGSIYVTGTTFSDSSMYDYITIRLNSNNGSEIWNTKYDYDQLNEAPCKIHYADGKVTVIGASQVTFSPERWELCTVNYDAFSGMHSSTYRTSTSVVSGINEVYDLTKDDNGNVYVVGAVTSLNDGYDIAIYKLDDSLNLVWEYYYDQEGFDDKAKGVKLDSQGNVIVTGFVTRQSEGKNVFTMKLGNSGNLIWRREFKGNAGLDDEGKNLVIDQNDRIIIAADARENLTADYNVLMYDSVGNLKTLGKFDGGLNDIVQSIAIDLEGNVIVVGQTQVVSSFKNFTVKYSIVDNNYDILVDSGVPRYLNGNILVKFNPNHVNSSIIDKRNCYSGELNQFIDSVVLSELQLKTGFDWGRFKVDKVHKRATTADSMSISRLGDTIINKSFWALLSIDVPVSWDEMAICDSLLDLENYIFRAAPNYVHVPHNTPNDLFYSTKQLGLFPNLDFPNADINVVDAWDKQVGQSYVKVGVMDNPINWAHEEFNSNVANLPGPNQKIGGGRNYVSNFDTGVEDQNTDTYHGTSVAGIIGAKRNNIAPGDDSGIGVGVAGIAGGDMTQLNFGVQLYSLGISNNNESTDALAAEAMREGFTNSPEFGYGLNIINFSWGSDASGMTPILVDAIDDCWRNHCVFVVSRGNWEGSPSNPRILPACYNDRKVINVLASGTDGLLKDGTANGEGNWGSMYGITAINNNTGCDVDFMAPGTIELISTTTHPTMGPAYSYSGCNDFSNNNYNCFNGTSAAAPHVSGVAALMYSQHHSNNGYPNNLATEDIEEIMQKTTGGSGYNLNSGYGLIDANQALIEVTEPYNVVHKDYSDWNSIETHIGTYSNIHMPGGSPENNIPINTTAYSVGKYKYTWNINEALPTGDEIIDWWNLDASTRMGGGLSATMANNGGYLGGNYIYEDLTVDVGGNTVIGEVSMYLYSVKVTSTSAPIWVPFDPNQLKYAYSLHVLKGPAGLSEHSMNKFNLFPNPSKGKITLEIDLLLNDDATIVIFDAMGRIIKQTKVTNLLTDDNKIEIDISQLQQGLYYCNLKTSSENLTVPFSKVD